jgi:hypothetical protein
MSMHAMIIASSLTAVLAAASVIMVLLQELVAGMVEKSAVKVKVADSLSRQRAQSVARDWAAFRTASEQR